MFFTQTVSAILAAFLAIIFVMVGLVMALDSIWRSKGMLRRALVFVLVAMLPVLARKISLFFGASRQAGYINFIQYSDVIATFFLMLAIFEIYKIIRSLDNEQ